MLYTSYVEICVAKATIKLLLVPLIFFPFPCIGQEYGNFSKISNSSQLHRNFILPPVSHDPDYVAFDLFIHPARSNVTQEIKYLDTGSLTRSSFIPNAVTMVFIHGFLDDIFDTDTTFRIMNGYLSSGIVGNFIAVNWTKLAKPVTHSVPDPNMPLGWPEFVTSYFAVLPNLPIVGQRVAEFLYWLLQNHVLDPSHLHVIGHSLGSHVAGEVGSRFQHLSGGARVRRITGMDPAGPLLEFPITLERPLNREDANFVDVIHTNVALFGDIKPSGDVDIFVNNGVVQPGCFILDFVDCSHDFVVHLYASGIQSMHIACECPLWRFVIGKCHSPCVQPILVGPYCSESARGIYHLKTTAIP